MLPVACLPIGGILMGIGYWIDPTGWGANSLLALLLIKAGGILIDNMAILFALGVASACPRIRRVLPLWQPSSPG